MSNASKPDIISSSIVTFHCHLFSSRGRAAKIGSDGRAALLEDTVKELTIDLDQAKRGKMDQPYSLCLIPIFVPLPFLQH